MRTSGARTPFRTLVDNRLAQRYQELALPLLRVMAGLLLMQHGLQKLFGLFGGVGGTPGATAPLASLPGVAGVLETFGGALIVLGLLTRPVAFLLAGEMAVAYFKSHAPRSFFPLVNRGEPAVLLCFIFLLLVAYGAGKYSLDSVRARAKTGR